MSLADAGLFAISGEGFAVGFTEPKISFDRMRQIQATAEAFDRDVAAYVKDPVFAASWKGWYVRWRQFYDGYELDGSQWLVSPQAMNLRAAVLAKSDEFASQVEGWRMQLEDFRAKYAALKDDSGQPLKSNTPIAPVPTPPIPAPIKASGFPWWGYALGAIAVAGLGAWAFWAFTEGRRKVAHAQSMAESLAMQRLGAHDPSPAAVTIYNGGAP